MSSPGEQALLPPSSDQDILESLLVWSSVLLIGGAFWAAMIWVVAVLTI